MMRLQNKVALITGGNSGIGRAIAELAVAEGARVVITGRNIARGEATVQALHQAGGQALFVPVELSEEEQVRILIEKTMAEYGALHVVVNLPGGNLCDAPLAQAWRRDCQYLFNRRRSWQLWDLWRRQSWDGGLDSQLGR